MTSEPQQPTDPTDAVTGLRTLPGMWRALEDRAEGGDGVGIIEFDLDDLKRINDTHGYPSGDRAIREAAAAARQALGADFELFRIGSDEFAAVATAPIEADDLFAAAERMRRAIEEGHLIAASFGVGFARPRDTPHGAVEAAWSAWQLAKVLGKNTIVDTEVVRHPLTDPRGLRDRWRRGEPAAAAEIVVAIPTRDQPAWASAVLAAARDDAGETAFDDLLDRVAETAADLGRWREGHDVFGAVRARTLAEASRPHDLGTPRILNVAELAAKVIYNASRPSDPFDADSAVRLVANAQAIAAEGTSARVSDRMWDALTSRCL